MFLLLLISFHFFHICTCFLFERFPCCSCSFLLILKGTHHQSNCHEETRATTQKRDQKEGEKRGDRYITTLNEGRQVTPLHFNVPYICLIWFDMTPCNSVTLDCFSSSQVTKGERQQEGGGGSSTTHKKEKEKAATPRTGEENR